MKVEYKLEKLILGEWEFFTSPVENLESILKCIDKGKHRLVKSIVDIINIEYETIDGKWWMFFEDKPYRELTDKESASVIWGREGQ